MLGSGFDPDAAAVPFNHLLADRQADAGAFVFLTVVQALEDLEDLVVELRCDAYAVIAHGESEVTVF